MQLLTFSGLGCVIEKHPTAPQQKGGGMAAENTPSALPRAVVAVLPRDSPGKASYAHRCGCGWNALAAADDPLRAEADLRELIEMHQKTCPGASSDSA